MSNQDLDRLLNFIDEILSGDDLPTAIKNKFGPVIWSQLVSTGFWWNETIIPYIAEQITLDDFHPVLTNILLDAEDTPALPFYHLFTSYEWIQILIFTLYSKIPKNNDPEKYKTIVNQLIKTSLNNFGRYGVNKVLSEVDSTDKTQMQLLNNATIKRIKENKSWVGEMIATIDYNHRVSLLADYGKELPFRCGDSDVTIILETLKSNDLSNLVMIYTGSYFGTLVRKTLRKKPNDQ